MKRFKNGKLQIDDISGLEDMIWMSYRYCIGRRSIASHTHADTIAEYSNILTSERKRFNASDIRECITDHVRGRVDWIRIIGRTSGEDVIFLLHKYLAGHPEIDSRKYKFEINLQTHEVCSTPCEETHEEFADIFSHLYIWSKLANYLDDRCHIDKTYLDNDKEITYKCYGYAASFINFSGENVEERYTRSYKILYDSVEKHGSMTTTRYLDPQKEVKR